MTDELDKPVVTIPDDDEDVPGPEDEPVDDEENGGEAGEGS